MNSETRRELTVADAVNAARRLESISDSIGSDTEPVELSSEVASELEDLLDAVVRQYEWNPSEFDEIYGKNRDPRSLGILSAKLLCRAGCEASFDKIVELFEWFVEDDEVDWLYVDGIDVIAASPESLLNSWLHRVEGQVSDSVAGVILDGVESVAKEDASVADSIRPQVAALLSEFEKYSIVQTTYLMRLAVELKAREAAGYIEQAFSQNRIDCGFLGDWEKVRKELGVEGTGLPMPPKPYNSLTDLRRKSGISCFSEEAFFLEVDDSSDASERYLDKATSLFADSPEGRAVCQGGEPAYSVRNFLDLGLDYCRATTDSMTESDVNELLLEIFPRKVTIDLSECDAVIDELVAFWKFCDRVYNLEKASEFAHQIAGLRSKFREAMGDPSNYGLAKSFVADGQTAGFDMTSEEGLLQFAAAYNATVHRRGSGPSDEQQFFEESLPHEPTVVPKDLKKRRKLLAKKRKASKRKNK